MCTSSPRPLSLLLALAAVAAAGAANAGPADDLLPPPVRQAEKRSLGGNDYRIARAYYDASGLGAAFSPDGRLLVTAGNHLGRAVWDVRTGRQLGSLTDATGNTGMAGAFTPDGKQFVIANWGGHQDAFPVAVWDVAKRQRLRSLDDDVNDIPFSAVAVAPDGTTIALAGAGGRRNEGFTLCFWDLASGDEVRRIAGLVNLTAVQARGYSCEALAYAPDGRSLAVLLPGRVLLVELATGKRRGEFTFTVAPAPPDRQGIRTGSLAYGPDGRTLAAGCSDGTIRRFDLRSGRELPPFSGHKGSVLAVCWRRDGKRLQSYGMDGQFFAWRTDPGREWKPKAGPLSDEALEELWEVLRGDDPRDLFGCQQVMAAAPDQAIPFLRKRLTPVPKADTERIARLIEDLQKGDYNQRKRAVRELRKIGAAAAPALARSQERGYDPLLRRLMFEFANLAPPPEQVRALRALGVLELIGNAGARKLLSELAGGAPEAALTLQAKAALERLGKAGPGKATAAPAALWDLLASEDSVVGYGAVRALAGKPTAAVLVRDRLKDVLAKGAFDDDPKRLAKLIGDLGSTVFAERDEASKALRNLGRRAVPTLRKALRETSDLETKRRLEELLDRASKVIPSPELLRVDRALEVLELTGGPEGSQALEDLAKTVRVKWVRDAVLASLRRQRGGGR